MRKLTTFKVVALSAGVAVSLACGGMFSSPDSLNSRNMFLLNLANGAGPIDARISDGSLLTEPLANNVPFGELSDEVEVKVVEYDLSARVAGSSSPYEAVSASVRAASPSVAVAMCPPSGPTCELYSCTYMGLPALVFFKDGVFQGASSLDIYVTAPGADISSVAPDGTLTENGKSLTLRAALHANTDYQVRATKAGTKDVVFDSGTKPGIDYADYSLFAYYHNGTTELTKTATFRSSTSGF